MTRFVFLFAAAIAIAAGLPALAQELPPSAAEMRKGYDRKAWGDWEPVEGCLTTRHAVLATRSLVRPTIRNCKVVAGRWRDAWTGVEITDPKNTDIDHVVAVQEAHDSGGYQWETAVRHRFFNDVENLVVTEREVNKRKGGYGPEAWLPDGEVERCFFVRRWIYIKHKWQLSADKRELQALRDALHACPAEKAVAPAAAQNPNAPIPLSDLYR
ncbi:GmrSD restriction endonuclease domain-containing protein [Azospirillum argentinense]|uniref:GmrSD restriction endonucleases C-terminal domain-containing protein n=1 Tax=Azospirillum argentinense TaxID=2970906 RepID=A0A5B0KQ03_9PROT|nr:DUF1524 domain-containing protein [Azospirillum argentinense]KAA1053823.1 hypothetical protein FH063_002405 [Azospirillum argentinense]